MTTTTIIINIEIISFSSTIIPPEKANNEVRPKTSNWIKEIVKCWFFKKNKQKNTINKVTKNPVNLKNIKPASAILIRIKI